MKKIVSIAAGLVLALSSALPFMAFATVSATLVPTSLVLDPILVMAPSPEVGLFKFSLSADAGETLSSVAVTVNKANASTTVSSSDLSLLSLYKDNGDGSLATSTDTLVGSQATVNIGSLTTISTSATTTATGTFFVALLVGPTWSGTAPADSITVTFPANGITTSAGALALAAAVTTNTITADTAGPTLTSAVAQNTGGTNAKEAGDSVELTFSESTNKPVISSSTISSYFSLSGGHSFLDTTGNLGAASWNTAGTVLTITLSGTTSPTSTLPTVAVGDVVSVVSSSGFKDLAGNQVSGSSSLTGSFSGKIDDEDENDDEDVKGNCANGLKNGKLYMIGSESTVYLAAACRLKPFRGAAVFQARGKKFQDIIVLSSLPENVSISQKPVLPAAGTLVKGKDKTVWFVDSHGKRRGFVSGSHFLFLGFSFGKVKVISDTDLALIPVSNPIENNEDHPDGAIIKCGNSAAVFQVIDNTKFPFSSGEAFTVRGNSFEHVLTVDCGRFKYVVGAAINP